MQNLQNELIELLKHEDNLVVDNQLNKNKIIEAALKVEPFLISLLIKNETFKKHFFQEVENVLVFDKINFQRFVNNKSFLPDSYTAFKNKIGLAINDDTVDNFIKTKNDVVLVWPHKDCVLEGGQTKEDQKRNEIFWNETLAPDSVDRLLDAKAFTNFKRYDKKGEHKITEFKGDENLILKGNNLLVLSSLLKTHRGKIKLIYIDPPYNTGGDTFMYNDSFNHSSWLTFMKNRLLIAKELLHPEGSIFIQIDDFEDAYLKVLMDELFKPENFRNKITWKRRGGSANPKNRLNNVVDYILWYSKNENFTFHTPFTIDDPNTKKYIKERFTNVDENGRKFMKSPLQSPNPRPNLMYDYKGFKTPKNGWSISEEKMKEWDAEGKLWFPDDKEKNINRKIYLDEYSGQPVSSLWTDISVINPMSKERGEFEGGQKPEALLHRIIEMVTDEGDYVLDFFVGSGTTCATAHKMNRKYIGVEQLNYIEPIPVQRIIDVTKGDEAGISKKVNWQGGGTFVYAELLEYNQYFVNKIQEAKTKENIIAIWSEMQDKAFISYQFDKDIFNNSLEAFKTASIETMQHYLIEILDKNQLYVNFSEIEDKSFNVSEEDKALNYSFYNIK
ncbi:DNA methyltransferase [Algibacter luteus]|uniref:site-specific DNA-methyltransferase (adenine-specific) n=1 Tax=Algibacter luteus TaxID=1178825 RepID=A0A1M6FFZ7_9FLAO|nr:site-specific DNA-methyltransferase [Algibacter luteus]SHI96648.1 adenine-specific DNA-methyltransferase [Algibacter luteus]